VSKILLLVLSLLLAMGVGEAGLRLLYPDGIPAKIPALSELPWVRYDAVNGWVNRPGDAYGDGRLVINADGMRGPEVVRPKPAGVLRILCMGDSRTFGAWSDLRREFESEYTPTLRRLASAGGAPVEALNAGVAGYSSAHILRQLNTRTDEWDPDLLLVAVGFNDLLLSWDGGFRMSEPGPPWLRRLFYASTGLRSTQAALRAAQLVPWRAAPLTVPWATPEEYRHNLIRIAERAREKGYRLLFIHLPLRKLELGGLVARPNAKIDPAELMELVTGTRDLAEVHRRYDVYRDLLFEVAREEDVPLLDVEPAFDAAGSAAFFNQYDFVHYNPTGARLVGELVFDRLVALGWLPPASGPKHKTGAPPP